MDSCLVLTVSLTPPQDDDPLASCNRFWEAEELPALPVPRHPDEAIAKDFYDHTISDCLQAGVLVDIHLGSILQWL